MSRTADPEATARAGSDTTGGLRQTRPGMRSAGSALAAAGSSSAMENREQPPARARRAGERAQARRARHRERRTTTPSRGLRAELLAVRDSLELGLEAGDKADARSLLAGTEATLKLLAQRLRERRHCARSTRWASRSIPQLHEAMAMQESAHAPSPIPCCRWCRRAISSTAGCCARRASSWPRRLDNRQSRKRLRRIQP